LLIVTLLISALALATSIVTAWLTLFRRGTIRMTHPTVIYLGADGGPSSNKTSKVYLRALLFCTAKRGRVLETMYVTLRRTEARQDFSVWVIGEDKLNRGSGLFVSENGVVANHHFLSAECDGSFTFREGIHHLTVFAKLVDEKNARKMFEQDLQIDAQQATSLRDEKSGLYFDWVPETGKYIPNLKTKREELSPSDVLDGLRLAHGLLEMTKEKNGQAKSIGVQNE
jgi:hypothetical protein